jgi:hypothetical protein
MAQCLSLKYAPKQITRPIHLEEMVQNNQKTGFYSFLKNILGPFGHPQIEPKRYLKACKWAGGMAQCLGLKISSYPNYQAHSFRENGPKQQFFLLFFYFGAIWAL